MGWGEHHTPNEGDWRQEVFPYDLGDENHRWSWLVRANDGSGGRKDLLWLHRCNGRWSTSWIDLTSGERHSLVSADPLTVQPSVLCPICHDHGFIRDGRWVSA